MQNIIRLSVLEHKLFYAFAWESFFIAEGGGI